MSDPVGPIGPSNLAAAGGFAKGLAQGAWQGAKSMASGIYDLLAMSADGYRQAAELGKQLYDSPEAREEAMQAAKEAAKEAGEFAKFLAEDPQQTLMTARDGALAAANAAKDKSGELIDQGKQAYADARARGEGAQFMGQAVGRTIFEVGTMLIGVGEASKAGKLAKVSELSKMGKVETVVLPCGRVVTRAELEAAKAGRAAEAGKAAEEAAAASKFRPQGWFGEAMDTQVGRDMVESMVAGGTDRDAAIGYVQEMLESGSALPVKTPVEKGKKLYKLVADKAGDYTPYWMSGEELEKLRGLSNAEIADRLGLPLGSMPKDGARFMVQEIEALEKTDVFVSQVAKTVEGQVIHNGGAAQSLVTEKLSKFGPASVPKPFR